MTNLITEAEIYEPEVGTEITVPRPEVDHANRIQVGTVGEDIGTSTMMAHCGGQEVNFADLAQIPVPEDTQSYSAVGHTDFVHSMYKHAERLLAPRGFKLDGERYVLDKQGNRLFFIHHYQNGDTKLQMAMGCRNSYDKSMKAAVSFGARVFVCDNLMISGDINIMRRHTGKVLDHLNEQIILNMYKASDGWDDMRQDRDTFAEYTIDEDDGYALMGLIKSRTAGEKEATRRILTTDTQWKSIQNYWEEPKHEYEGGNRTLWAWYNSFTFDFRSLKPNEQLQKHASLHQFTKSTIGAFNGSNRARDLLDQLKEADPAQFANDTQRELMQELGGLTDNEMQHIP